MEIVRIYLTGNSLVGMFVMVKGASRRMEQFLQNLRYGARILERNPGFTIVSIITLAIGIGANTAIFTLVNGLMLKPLPYKEKSSQSTR